MAKAKATSETGAETPDSETVADVLDAAATLADASASAGTAEEQIAAELAGAAPAFEQAAAAAPAPTSADVEAAALDQAAAEARALADALNANPLPVKPLRIDEFPAQVILRNNSIVSLSEMVTGAFLQAGGSATVTLHDEEHAQAVAESLQKLVEENYLPRTAVAVDLA